DDGVLRDVVTPARDQYELLRVLRRSSNVDTRHGGLRPSLTDSWQHLGADATQVAGVVLIGDVDGVIAIASASHAEVEDDAIVAIDDTVADHVVLEYRDWRIESVRSLRYWIVEVERLQARQQFLRHICPQLYASLGVEGMQVAIVRRDVDDGVWRLCRSAINHHCRRGVQRIAHGSTNVRRCIAV